MNNNMSFKNGLKNKINILSLAQLLSRPRREPSPPDGQLIRGAAPELATATASTVQFGVCKEIALTLL